MKRIYTKIKFILICAVFFSATNLIGQNLLLNPSFESGVPAPWEIADDAFLVDEGAQHGTYALDGNIEQYIDLEANTEYTYTIYVKNLTPDIKVWSGIKNIVDDLPAVNYGIFSTDYELATITITSGSAGSYRFWVWGQGGSHYISDNAVLLKAGTTVGTTDAELEENIHISNSQDGIVVKIDSDINNASISVFDLSGRKVMSTVANQGTTIIENREFTTSGIYVVTVQADRAIKSDKVVIAK